MSKGSSKQRAKKKQQKQQQRKTKLARREGKAAAPKGFGAREKPTDLFRGWEPTKQGITGLAQRRHLAFVDAAHYAEAAQRANHPGTATLWTPQRVAALSDEEVLAKLAALGVTTDRDAFLAATAADFSAFPHAGTPWSRGLPAGTPPTDHDFVLLAAWDLWRRWRPERPSREMLLVRHLDGWDADGNGRPGEAIDTWLEFGQMIWRAFPDARRMTDIDDALNDPGVKLGVFYFEAFAEVLVGLATEEALHEHDHERANRTAAYIREIVARLPDSLPAHLELLQAGLADLLEANHQYDEARALLNGMIERSPHRGIGYVLRAEAIVDVDEPTADDFREAIAMLRRGLGSEDANQWEIPHRIQALEEELAALTK